MSTRLTTDVSAAPTPTGHRASVMVALLPVAVLLALTLVVGDLIAADTGLFAVAAAIVWLVFEMVAYQRLVSSDEDTMAALGGLTAPAPLAD